VPLGQAEPIAASTAGQAAAAAPALETKATELGTAGAAPMFTNEPIVNEQAAPASEPLEAPTFSSLDATARRESGGGSGFLKIAAILLIVGVGGYFGWQKFQPMQYLHRSSATDSSAGTAAESETAVSAQQAAAPTEQPPQTAVNSTPTPSAPTTQAPVPTISAGDVEKDSHKHPASSDDDGTIELQELPLAPGAKPNFTKVTITPRGAEPAPLQVKSDAGNSEAKSKAAQMQAPSVQIAASNDDAEVANLIAAPVALPKAAPGTVRVSQGVSQGLLLKKVAPIYPPEALRIHKEGIVQLLATVSKSGNISNVRVLGGDPTLAQAAADAVLRWKYRPYLLNGQPVEIETQISVVFKAPH
jgi:TonB family protein